MEPTTISYYGCPSLFSLLCVTFDLVSEHLTLATKANIGPETAKLITFVLNGLVFRIFDTLEYKGKRDPRLHSGISDNSLSKVRGALKVMILNVRSLNCSVASLLDKRIHSALLTSDEVEIVIDMMENILQKIAEIKEQYGLDIYLTFQRKVSLKLCEFALEGICEHGLKCKFPHNEEKLQHLIEASQTKCRLFYKLGFCPYGRNCKYSHFTPEIPVADGETGDSNNVVKIETTKEPIYIFDDEKPKDDLN